MVIIIRGKPPGKEGEPTPPSQNSLVKGLLVSAVRKGTINGVSTSGVTATFTFVDRGTFWVLQLTYFYLPKSARMYLLPQSVKMHYFCSGPLSVDPICPQPIAPSGSDTYLFVPYTHIHMHIPIHIHIHITHTHTYDTYTYADRT